MVEKICKTCAQPFQRTANRQIYCASCGRTGTGTCEHCGVTFKKTPNTSGRWCSADCSYASRRQADRKERVCETCGLDFKPSQPHSKFCSRSCSSKAHAARTRKARTMKLCAVCGTQFDATRHPRQATCSVKCRGIYRRGGRNNCERCGVPIETRYRQQRFCSAACRATPIGTRQQQRDGYIRLYVGKEHPMANRNGWAAEHRAVLSDKLGRALHARERVHHINGDRADNRPENLELWRLKHEKSAHPAGVRASDYHCPGCRCGSE